MEERLPPLDTAKEKPPLPPPPAPSAASLETYVVQVPRDQIYRVPPPEHARIVEDHTRNLTEKKQTCRTPVLWIILPAVILFVLTLTVVMAIRATLYNPTPPEVTISRVQGKNLVQGRPEFDVTLRADNPNTRMSVSYRGSSPGSSTLVFKNEKIAVGGIPSGVRLDSGSDGVDFPVVLAGNGAALTAEMKKRLNDVAEKAMALKFEVAMEMKSWVRNEEKQLKVSCDFKVKNSLTGKNKISSQDCSTEFQD